MASTTNHGTATGRLASAPRFFPTQEGGPTKVLLTVMVNRPLKNQTTGERDADAVPLTGWIRAGAEGPGVYGMLGKGDLVSTSYTVRSSSWADQNTGEMNYRIDLTIDQIEMLESRSVTQHRRITHLEAQQAAQEPDPLQKANNRRAKLAESAA